MVALGYLLLVSTIGVRELRQSANEILREVEAGQATTVTAAGRPVARLVPLRNAEWTTWEPIQEVFDTPTDRTWDDERPAFGAPGLDDPWSR